MNRFKNILTVTLATLAICAIVARACVVDNVLSLVFATIFVVLIIGLEYHILRTPLIKSEDYAPVLVAIPTSISLFTFVATAAMQIDYEICTTAIISGCIALYGMLILIAVLFKNNIKKGLSWETGILLGLLLLLIGFGLLPLNPYIWFIKPLAKVLGLLGISTFLLSIAFMIADACKK